MFYTGHSSETQSEWLSHACGDRGWTLRGTSPLTDCWSSKPGLPWIHQQCRQQLLYVEG